MAEERLLWPLCCQYMQIQALQAWWVAGPRAQSRYPTEHGVRLPLPTPGHVQHHPHQAAERELDPHTQPKKCAYSS